MIQKTFRFLAFLIGICAAAVTNNAAGPDPAMAHFKTPEIEALAAGLGKDPVRIFNYVHDNIRHEFYRRAKKGAALTLLEKSGNDADQCALLIALLNATTNANITSLKYHRVTMNIPLNDASHNDLTHWLRLNLAGKTDTEVTNYLAELSLYRGFGSPITRVGTSTNLFSVLRHVVQIVYNGQTHDLDPGFKVSESLKDVAFNLYTEAQLSTNALLTAAGGGNDASFVVDLQQAAVGTELANRASALSSNLTTSAHAGKAVSQIAGGWRIVPSTATSLDQMLPISHTGGTDWSELQTADLELLQFKMDGEDWDIYSHELLGKPLSLSANSSKLIELRHGDEVKLSKTLGAGVSEFELRIDFGLDSKKTTYQAADAQYALFYSFDPSEDFLRLREDELAAAREADSDASPAVIRATLQVMGMKWRLQTAQVESLLAEQAGILPLWRCQFGRMAQEAGHGYGVDSYFALYRAAPNSGWTNGDWDRQMRYTDLSEYFKSALEHGLIEQLQSSNLVAASAVKMLSLAGSDRIYLANVTNWSTVTANLTNYGSTTLDYFHTNFVTNGYSILLPKNGAQNVGATTNTWAGYGAAAVGGVATNRGTFMLITGGYKGAHAGVPSATPQPSVVAQASFATMYKWEPIARVTGGDPVNMADGSFRLEATDLAFGEAPPRGLSFSRFYSSRRRGQNPAHMANGWLHNYYFQITETSVPEAGLGTATPAQAAPMLVATCAAWNLYTATPDVKKWAVTALIANWGVDQLINRSVSIDMGNETLLFVKQPDGTYTPPAGNTMTLTKNGSGNFQLRERNGRLFAFNSDKQLEMIEDVYGKKLTITYDGSKRPETITDWTNRVLALGYSGTPARLTSITNTTGSLVRTVTYQYTTNFSTEGDLTGATDVESKTSSYEYDDSHRLTRHEDAKTQAVTENVYDGFGRVSEQFSEGDTDKKWQFFWTGVENSTMNPSGNVERYYYDKKTRLVGRMDGSGIRTSMEYDGEDHVVRTVTPVSTNRFQYNAAKDLQWSEDPLGKKTHFYYDSSNRLHRVVDPRGYTNTTLYNTKHQVVRQENPMGNWVEYLYDTTHGTLSKHTNAALGVTTFTYDSYGQLANVIHPSGLGTNTTTRNPRGDVTTTFDGQRIQTDFTWNKRRQLTDVAGPLSQSTHTLYDDNGEVWKTQDGRSYWTERAWTATRKLKTTTLPTVTAGTAVLENIYDERDWLESVKDPLLNLTRYEYRANGAVSSVTEPIRKHAISNEVQYTVFTYDAGGRRVRSWNVAPNETNRFQFNARGEAEVAWDPLDDDVGRVYDDGGNLIKLTNRLNNIWTFQYDAANRLTNSISPESRETRQGFDTRGLLHWRREPSGQSNVMVYDQRSRLATNTDTMGSKLYLYDFNSNLTNITEGGQTVRWNYDAYNRPSRYTDGLGAQVEYGYDANGNLTNLNYAARNVSYTYDARNQLTEVRDWKGRKTFLEYDLNGRLKKVTRPNGTVREIGYNDGGQTTNIVERTATGAGIAFGRLNWNAAQRAEWEWLGPKPRAWTPPARTSVVVDKDNWITNYHNGVANVQVIHDLDGNMTSGPDARGVPVGHAYNTRNQLANTSGSIVIVNAAYAGTNAPTTYSNVGAAGEGYGPVNLKVAGGGAVVARVVPSAFVRNNFSGWVGFKFTTGPGAVRVNELGRWVLPGNSRDHVVKLVDSTGANVANGQTTVVTAGAVPHQFAYGTLTTPVTLTANSTYYLVSEELNTGDTWYDYGTRNLGPGSWTYTYDSAGHRLRADNGAVGYRYVWNPSAELPQVLIRANPDGTTTYYIHGTGGIGLLYEITESAGGIELGTRTYHYDYRGSTVALTDGGANVTDRIEYSAYGQISYRTGRTDTPFLFNGRFGVQTDGNGLLYMHARYYNPYLCRFMNADPSSFEGGLNFYAFADGNPISLIDPFGLGAQGMWYDQWGGWIEKGQNSFKGFMENNTPWGVAGTANTVADVVGGILRTPQALGHLGEGTGTFFGNPTLENSAGMFMDISLTAGTLAGVGGMFQKAVPRNPNVYEALFEAPINGTSRASHRASANEHFANYLRNDPQLNTMFNQELGANVVRHMESGTSGLLNPPGTAWHHPANNPNVVHLLRTSEHTAPALQPVLHPGGVGGFGNFYGP